MQTQSFHLPPTSFALDFINQFKCLHDYDIESKAIKLHHDLLESRTAMNAMANNQLKTPTKDNNYAL